MTFLSPLALALASVGIPIVLLWMLRRRIEQDVSSNVLWRRALEGLPIRSPWLRLRPTLLLLLELLAVAALVLTLAQPAYVQTEPSHGDLIVIVDQSMAMQGRDVRPSRFQAAVGRVRTLAQELAPGHVMSVIGMGSQPSLAVADSSNRGAIDHALDSLHPGFTAPNFPAALSLAVSVARQGVPTQLLVLTSPESAIASLPMNVTFPVEIDRLGGHLRDVGITAFTAGARRTSTRVVVEVHNFGGRPVRSDLDLDADGQLVDVRPLSVAPGRSSTQTWDHLPPGITRLRAHLGIHDDLPADKTAWAVVPVQKRTPVVLVSDGDYFLQTALRLDPDVRLTALRPSQYRAGAVANGDVGILDGVKAAVPPTASVLLVAPLPGRSSGLEAGSRKPVGSLNATPDGEASGLTRGVQLAGVHVLRVRMISAPGWLHSVVRSGRVPVVLAGENGQHRLVVMPFRLEESDWPLQVSFPVLVQNVVRYLAPPLITTGDQGNAGSPVELRYQGIGSIQVTGPDGSTQTLPEGTAWYRSTEVPGIYTVRAGSGGGDTAQFAVNAFSPRLPAAFGAPVLRFHASSSDARRTLPTLTLLSSALGLLALLVLSVEWWAAFRQ